jgi:hypothetical protein
MRCSPQHRYKRVGTLRSHGCYCCQSDVLDHRKADVELTFSSCQGFIASPTKAVMKAPCIDPQCYSFRKVPAIELTLTMLKYLGNRPERSIPPDMAFPEILIPHCDTTKAQPSWNRCSVLNMQTTGQKIHPQRKLQLWRHYYYASESQ